MVEHQLRRQSGIASAIDLRPRAKGRLRIRRCIDDSSERGLTVVRATVDDRRTEHWLDKLGIGFREADNSYLENAHTQLQVKQMENLRSAN